MDGLDLFYEKTTPPALYKLGCPHTLIKIIALTPCFGFIKDGEAQCALCPLRTHCKEKKEEIVQKKRQLLESRRRARGIALEAGYDLTKTPKSAKLKEMQEIKAKISLPCVISNKEIAKGEECFFIPSWGIVKFEIGLTLQQLGKDNGQ